MLDAIDKKRWQVIGRARHPRDSAGGTLVRNHDTGIYGIVHGFGFRSVPQGWAQRKHEELDRQARAVADPGARAVAACDELDHAVQEISQRLGEVNASDVGQRELVELQVCVERLADVAARLERVNSQPCCATA